MIAATSAARANVRRGSTVRKHASAKLEQRAQGSTGRGTTKSWRRCGAYSGAGMRSAVAFPLPSACRPPPPPPPPPPPQSPLSADGTGSRVPNWAKAARCRSAFWKAAAEAAATR